MRAQGTILVKGPALGTAVVGAYLASRCVSADCAVRIAITHQALEEQRLLARPDVHRFHHEIGLDSHELESVAGLRPAFVTRLGETSDTWIPFAPMAKGRSNVDLLHYWLRADAQAAQPPFHAFSAAVALAQIEDRMSLRQADGASLDYGVTLQRDRYVSALLDHARKIGAYVVEGDPSGDADLVVDCGAHNAGARWEDGYVAIGKAPEVPGFAIQHLVNVAKRLLSLSVLKGNSEMAQREFNRLSEDERDRMADVADFVSAADSFSSQRACVQRKIDLFRACGRVAQEDYDVFAVCEWQALLMSRGLRPMRYDRLADAVSHEDLVAWLADCHRAVRSHATLEAVQ